MERRRPLFSIQRSYFTHILQCLGAQGVFPIAEMGTFRKIDSRLQGHPTTHEGLPGVWVASGSLSQGMSVANGAAQAKKLNGDTHLVFSLHGDGELLKAINWISTQTNSKKSDYSKKVDLEKIAAGGQSCGGAQTLRVADDRAKTYMIFNAGMGDMTMAGASAKSLDNLHGKIVYIIGGESDIAYENAILDFDRIKNGAVAFANHKTAGRRYIFRRIWRLVRPHGH